MQKKVRAVIEYIKEYVQYRKEQASAMIKDVNQDTPKYVDMKKGMESVTEKDVDTYIQLKN